jgi:uncharacterized membrane protein
MKNVKQLFINGLFAILPIVVTIYVLYLVVSFLDNILGGFVELIIGKSIPGVGLVASIGLIIFMGFIVTNYLGSKLIKLGEKLLEKIPIISNIYFGVKQIINAFSIQGKEMFNKVVLVEYPRKGTYALGFITGQCKGEVQDRTSAELINVFIPTTPNPTSGMLILVPNEEIIYLDMSVEEGLKLIVSAGIVVPEYK